jgi:hypothetical protein
LKGCFLERENFIKKKSKKKITNKKNKKIFKIMEGNPKEE